MTVNKIYIAAFGGLKDYTLELDSGLNVIFGENENGKTTVMNFVKMMFYGTGKGSRQISKNARIKYTPWDGSPMGGRIYFEHEGHRYCLEREFKKSNSTDRITLRNLDMGTSESVSGDIGKRFFGLSEEAFERSVFIGTSGAFDSNEDASGELNAKLSNIAVTGDESTSYRIISKRISDAVGELTTQRHVGIYDKGCAKLKELNSEYIKADEKAKHLNELSDKIKLYTKRLTEIKQKYEAVKKTVDSENDVRLAEKMREYLSVKAELDELNKTLLSKDGKLIDTIFIGKVNFCISKLENEQRREEEKLDEVRKAAEDIEITEKNRSIATPEKIDELKADIDAVKQQKDSTAQKYENSCASLEKEKSEFETVSQKKKSFNPALLISGITVLVLGIIAAVFYPPLAAVAAVGAVLTVLSFIIRPLDKSAILDAKNRLTENERRLTELKSKEANLQGELNGLVNELNMMVTAMSTDKALLEQKKSALKELEDTAAEIQTQKRAALKELLNLYSRYRETEDLSEIKSSLNDLTKRTETQKSIKLRLQILSKDLGNISYEEAAEKLKSIENSTESDTVDFDAEKKKLEMLNQEGISLTSDLSSIITEYKTETKTAKDPEYIKKEIAELSENLENMKKYIESANLANEVLEDSFAEVRRSYGSQLEKRTLQIFSMLTGGRYDSVNISKNMEMETETKGDFNSYSIDYLSSGTVDQAYLSLRLAVAELMESDEKLPVFLDDSLSQYDDSRVQKALEFLNIYSKDSQTVLFTCHNSICDYSKKLNVSVKSLKN